MIYKNYFPFIISIITLSLELAANIIMLFIYKMGDSTIEGLALALWSWPLLILVIISLLASIIRFRHKEERNKKDKAALIMSIVSLVYFFIYAIMLGFLIGTGHLPFYYFPDGF